MRSAPNPNGHNAVNVITLKPYGVCGVYVNFSNNYAFCTKPDWS